MEFTQNEQRDLYNSITDIKTNMARVLFMLESDGRTNSKGLVEKVEVLEAKLAVLEQKEKFFSFKIVTLVGVGVALFSGIVYAAEGIFNYFVNR